MTKISKHDNFGRPIGQIALNNIKGYIKKMSEINECVHKRNRNIVDILNEDSFINIIPDDQNVDHNIYIDENYYD